MKLKITEGDYNVFGTIALEDGVIFTFLGELEDECKIRLINKKTKEEILIDAPIEYCKGSLRSVFVRGFQPKNYSYDYLINGESFLDPYARLIHGREKWMNVCRKENRFQLKCGFLTEDFDWGLDQSPEISRNEMIMYKLHMRGFTMDKGAVGSSKGTFAGLKDKIAYLKALGITTIEVMPIYEFEEIDIPQEHKLPDYVKWDQAKSDMVLPLEDKISDKPNFWGYGPGNYFAVKASYASKPNNAVNELKDLIRELHKNNMELIMEFYFPVHTNHSMILDALRFWVAEYHVDGFHLLGDELPLVSIAEDALLSRTKMFYLGFDAHLLENRRHENLFVYKDEYQYPAKKVLNHMNADMVEFINQQKKQGPNYSYVNYITGNNGFTLNDLFSYNDRHNEANGEGNLDGNPWNFSNNQGVEGPCKKKGIVNARTRQWRNAFMMLLTAQSVPLIWSGDEFRNSQFGNNNAYCQDNEIGWVNWKKNRQVQDDINFVTRLIQFRKTHPIISSLHPFTYSDYKNYGLPDFSLHGESAWVYDLNPGGMSLGVMYNGAYAYPDATETSEDVYIGYNFYSGKSILALPKLSGEKKWYLLCDSADFESGFYSVPKEIENQTKIEMSPQSVFILIGK